MQLCSQGLRSLQPKAVTWAEVSASGAHVGIVLANVRGWAFTNVLSSNNQVCKSNCFHHLGIALIRSNGSHAASFISAILPEQL